MADERVFDWRFCISCGAQSMNMDEFKEHWVEAHPRQVELYAPKPRVRRGIPKEQSIAPGMAAPRGFEGPVARSAGSGQAPVAE